MSIASTLKTVRARLLRSAESLGFLVPLLVRLTLGWEFVNTGWGKLHSLPDVTEFFASLHIPMPGLNAAVASSVEFFGGILLMLGLGTRFIGLLLAVNMMVAYWTADREALTSIFSDPGKLYVADPYTFLFASLMVLIFGAGLFSLDAFVVKRFKEKLTQ